MTNLEMVKMVPCKKHPRYKGMREPTVDCSECWRVYWQDPTRKSEEDFRKLFKDGVVRSIIVNRGRVEGQ